MSTKVTFRAYVKDDDDTYYVYRISFLDVERITDILKITKDEFFRTSLTDRVVVNYDWKGDSYRCTIDRI